ncbi:putative ubiquitin carboxyl-terminal hydrolase protein [Botrytis fragariae]|uniref:Ubiquitin carboxyl-terminal hydrolase n=1 Tax=Botrytis fragariae TaxID=1964551 RepID=A0A8H6AZW6_9HELO|nr:putative ubiquitin carboxyl-terminal hydrolase protein [Botrytis fragariae]KAF5876532.1 putative ubiquitin carboxyl-terminal hydrolase protein [Botrytis fragariae]
MGLATSRLGRFGQNIKRSESEILDDALKPLTDDERKSWKGWCELESDPALFNYILREYGVKDVKIQEVLGLEDEMLQYLRKPVYGLVFLFKYIEDDSEDEETPLKCPNHIWFANQTTHNACATIALLNIVMNVPNLDLGDGIRSFKEDTQSLKPAYRGQKLSQNEFIRNIHNSFARRMDILNADLGLSNEVSAWKKKRKTKKKSGRSKSRSDVESGFHFIAFVPVEGVVWRLDGLQRQPVTLGPCNDDWISVARASIYEQIIKYGDDLQFNLLSLCRSPLRIIPLELAQNIHAIKRVEDLLAQRMSDWNDFNQVDDSELMRGPSEEFGVTDKLLHDTALPESTCNILERESTNASALLGLQQQWASDQKALRIAYREELALIDDENEQAARRKKDHTPIVYRTLKSLADKGILKEIIDEVQAV